MMVVRRFYAPCPPSHGARPNSGLAVGLVERGRLVFARGFGYRDTDTHLPVTPDTLFALGSCSKAFTATAIALLADEGKIALDSPVRTYLPGFALKIRWRQRP